MVAREFHEPKLHEIGGAAKRSIGVWRAPIDLSDIVKSRGRIQRRRRSASSPRPKPLTASEDGSGTA
jgi:hypothetical protein